MFSYIKIKPFYLRLRLLNCARNNTVRKRYVFGHIKPGHDVGNCISSKKPHYLIIKTYEEKRFSGIPLSSRSSSQLIIDPSRLVSLCPNNIKPPKFYDLVVFFLPFFPLDCIAEFPTVFSFWSISS